MNPQDQSPSPAPQAPAPAPAPEPPSVPPSTPTAMPTAGKSKNSMLIVIIVAALIVAAGIAYGVYAYISNQPENMVKSAMENLTKEKSLAASLKITSGASGGSVSFTGDVAATSDPSNSKNGEVIVGVGSDSQRVSLNALSLDGTLYLKLTGAENLGPLLQAYSGGTTSSASMSAVLKNLNSQWFEITKEQVQSIAESSGNDSVSGAVSPQDLKKALEIYNQHPFIKADKTFADEVVDGSNSAHFSLKIDKDEIVKFMQALKDANMSTIKVTDADIADAKQSDYTTKDGSVEMWISRDTRKFKQIRFSSTKEGSEASITLTLKGQLPTFDKFEKPSDVKPISQLYSTLLGPSFSSTDLMLQ